MDFFLELIVRLVSTVLGQDADETAHQLLDVVLPMLVGWIVGAFPIAIIIRTTWPGSYNTWNEISRLLLNAFLFTVLGGPLGGLMGARIAEGASRAAQIATAAFFGVLGGLLFGAVCIALSRLPIY